MKEKYPRIYPLRLKGIPSYVKRIVKTLEDSDYITYLVGGCVRDLILGIPPKDFDIGTSASLEEIQKVFPKSEIIGKRFPIVHVYINKKGDYVEVSPFRGREELDRILKENYGTPQEDALRRDLTINSLFYDLKKKLVIDYTGGFEDLNQGIIRVIGNPEKRFKQDPVRILRTLRHAARLGFRILPEVKEALERQKPLIRLVPFVRLRDELLKDITSSYVTSWAKLLKKFNLFYEIYPFIKKLEKKGLFSWKEFFKVLEILEKEEFSEEERIALFVYSFLGLIKEKRTPEKWRKVPSFEREELLELFWALFFTFRFRRGLFENSMDIFRDTMKVWYLLHHGYQISRKYKKKRHFKSSLKLARLLEENFKDRG